MRKLSALLLVALSFTFTACGEDDPSFNNRESCEDFINAYNALECVEGAVVLDAEQTCSGYNDSTVDCSRIFDCWVSNMMCEDLGGGIMTVNNYTMDCPTTCE